MKFKYLFLGFMLLILAGSMTAIAAADDYESLGDYTFDIPDGYQVTDKTDEMVTMQVDEDHPIIVYKLDSVADVDSFISLLETTGCKLVSEDAFQAGPPHRPVIVLARFLRVDRRLPGEGGHREQYHGTGRSGEGRAGDRRARPTAFPRRDRPPERRVRPVAGDGAPPGRRPRKSPAGDWRKQE